ncbi:MAG TPA: hypothetical protein VFP20_10460 [Bacteroidales bacterium]|nr:hypothetical protein [Bacteroidales bacterium]
MKKTPKMFLSLILLSLCSFSLFAENSEIAETESTTDVASTSSIEGGEFDMGQMMEKTNSLGAYFGYTNIGGENVIGFRIQPDFQIGKLGIGLDIPVQFSITNKSFRTEEFKDGVGLLRMIRFLSWGTKKQDDYYIKVGDLTGSFLGYGMLINNYSNSISIDKRKIGVDLDFCFGKMWGIEVLYSDVNVKSLNLLGIRPYIRPLGLTGIPIIKTFDIGVQYVTDRDKTGDMLAGDASSNHNTFIGNGGVNAEALDMGVTLLNMPMIRLQAFGSAARMERNRSSALNQALQDSINGHASAEYIQDVQNYQSDGVGYGLSAGLDLKFKFLGNMLRLDARAERLWYTNNFIPHFFDVSYEMNKDARIMEVVTAKAQKGYYAELGLMVLSKIMVSGGLLMPDNMGPNNPALLRLILDGSKISKSIVLEGEYVKGGLTSFNDVISLDERSLVSVRAAYKLLNMFCVGVDYNWTWANVGGKFKPSSYVSPYVGVKFDLPFMNK